MWEAGDQSNPITGFPLFTIVIGPTAPWAWKLGFPGIRCYGPTSVQIAELTLDVGLQA